MTDVDSPDQSRLERLLGQAWDALPIAAVIVDEDGIIRHCSDQTNYLLGYEPGNLVGEAVERLMAKGEASGAPAENGESGGLAVALGGDLEFYARHRNGTAVPVRLSLTQVGDAGEGDGVWTLLLMQDQRPYQEARETSAHAEKRYWQLFNQNQVGLLWLRVHGEVLSCNPAAADMFGYDSPAEFEGHSLVDHYRGDAEDRRKMLRRLQQKGEASDWNVPMARKDGTPFTILENLVLQEDSDYDEPVIVCSFVEVTEQARLWEELKEMAYHDPLTGLPNRRFLEEQARKVFALAERRERFAGVAYLDLDGFKAVNDQWGHPVGDEVLVAVAERMERSTRESDVVARIGGDEFAVVWADLDVQSEAVIATRRILETFNTPFQIGEKSLSLGLSAGVATYPTDGNEIGDLLERADDAMYEAKAEGQSLAIATVDQASS